MHLHADSAAAAPARRCSLPRLFARALQRRKSAAATAAKPATAAVPFYAETPPAVIRAPVSGLWIFNRPAATPAEQKIFYKVGKTAENYKNFTKLLHFLHAISAVDAV